MPTGRQSGRGNPVFGPFPLPVLPLLPLQSSKIKELIICFSKTPFNQRFPNYLADLTKKPWVVYSQMEKRKALLLKEYGAKRETYAVIMPLAA
jgi:hypothetical protein